MPGTVGDCYVVEDEPVQREAAVRLLRAAGHRAEGFPHGAAFLEAADALPPGCVLLDLRMPGPCGLSVQREIAARRLRHAVVLLTGHATVALAVRAMQAGACDVLEKPAGEALRRAPAPCPDLAEAAEAERRIARLSPREMEVLRAMLAGRPNKGIARQLGLSPRTVEEYRGGVLAKIGAGSLPELTRLALAAGVAPEAG